MECGLIFDLDGTLVDSLPGIAASLNKVLRDHGLPVHPAGDVRGFIGNGSQILIERAAPQGAEVGKIEQAFKEDYDTSWPTGTTIYPGIPELLGKLSGLPLAVLSNKPHAFTVAMVNRLFPDVSFSAIVGQRPGIPHKPDPAGALEIARGFGLEPGKCTIIGDSTMDLETARAAGMHSIAVTWGYHDRGRLLEARPDHLIDRPAELLDFYGFQRGSL